MKCAFRPGHRPWLPLLYVLMLLPGALALPRVASASCDIIPQSYQQIRSPQGLVDSPYGVPGQALSVTLDSADCDAGSPADPGTRQVSVFYLAPTGAVNVVTSTPSGIQPAQCGGLPGGGQHLFDVDAGLDTGIPSETFPFTLSAVGGFAGPARIAIQPVADLMNPPTVPCALATTRCADYVGTPLLGCVDELYEEDGTCSESSESLSPLFSSFTALPPENFFRDLCSPTPEAPNCTGNLPDLQMALDAAGNLILPLNLEDIESPGALPVPRFVTGRTSIEAFTGSGTPPELPGSAFYSSFSSRGRLLPPFFSDIEDPGDPLATALLGTVDAERSVLRFLRRSPFFLECRDDGTDAVLGVPCALDADCPAGANCGASVCYSGGAPTATPCASDSQCGMGSECGPSLFDFSTRLSLAGAGPLRIPSPDYVVEAQNQVPLDCLFQTDDVIVACRSEGAEGVDLNGDGDSEDETVVALRDRATGEIIPIGGGGTQGIAATRARNGAFSDPSIEVEGDVVAFLQPEGGTSPGATDENADGDYEDALLRVIELEPGSFSDVIAPGTIEAASDPVINDRSLVFEDGLVFFRRSEFDGTPQGTFNTALESDPVTSPVRTTPDGRFVVFSRRTSPPGYVYEALQVVDRDPDENGILDDVPAVVDATPFAAWNGSISDDGRYVAFESSESFVAEDLGIDLDVYVWDRVTDSYQFASAWYFFGTNELDGPSYAPQISSSGRYIAFLTEATDLGFGGDANGTGVDLAFADRGVDPSGPYGPAQQGLLLSRVNALPFSADGGDGQVLTLFNQAFDISRDERWIAFATDASDYPNLNPGVADTNQSTDVYVRELLPENLQLFVSPSRVSRLSLRTATDDGAHSEFLGTSWAPTLSGDGRFVAWLTNDLDFPGIDPAGLGLLAIVRDRDPDENGVFDEPEDDGTPRFAQRAYGILNSLKEDGLSLSPEGRFLQLGLDTRDDVNEVQIMRLIDVARGEVLGDRIEFQQVFNPDGERPLGEDRLFRSFEDWSDLGQCCPTLHYGRVTGLDTADLSNDLNADGRADDDLLSVVDTRVDPAQIVTLAPAEEARVDGGNTIFLVREADIGLDGTDLNADLDTDDEVVFVWEAAATGLPANPFVNQQLAATDIAISGSTLAALVPQPSGDRHLFVAQLPAPVLGSWSDTGIAADQLAATPSGVSVRRTDGALEVLDPGTLMSLATVAGPVEDFVAKGSLVAFRMEESGVSLNGDGDTDDFVLQVLDVPIATVFDSEQAAIPCPYEACDPSQPYRITGQVVRFLTREADQGNSDLDGDGTATGVVYQTFNLAAERVDAYPTVTRGLCTDNGAGCNEDVDCGAGICFTPPGGCVRDLATPCVPANDQPCPAGQFCQPIPGTNDGTCFELFGVCETDTECTLVDPSAFCVDDAQEQRPPDPLLMQPGGGGLAYLTRGACLDGGGDKTGTCRVDADCPQGSTCAPDLLFSASADMDGDGVADVVDLCETVANPDQLDTDSDGIGDACDRATCGNGIQEYDEECDSGFGCDAACAYVGAGACADGFDNDGDGLIDLADPGCSNGADTSERQLGLVCDDGIDNDGDFGVDFPGDPGCWDSAWPLEMPQCSDGIDNDGDGRIDHDGGANGGVIDPQCNGKPWKNKEKQGCGLGFELALLLPLLLHLRRRRR